MISHSRSKQGRSGPWLPHKQANKTNRGKWADFPGLNKARWGRIYMQTVWIEQAFLKIGVSLEEWKKNGMGAVCSDRLRGVVTMNVGVQEQGEMIEWSPDGRRQT